MLNTKSTHIVKLISKGCYISHLASLISHVEVILAQNFCNFLNAEIVFLQHTPLTSAHTVSPQSHRLQWYPPLFLSGVPTVYIPNQYSYCQSKVRQIPVIPFTVLI